MSIRRIVTVDQAEWSMAPPPAWRLPREIDWRYRAPADETVAWLLVDEQYHAASQSRSCRWVRQLLSIAAVQALAQVEIEFEPDAQRLLVHEVVVWRQAADGAWHKSAPVAAEAFLLRQREQQFDQQVLHGRVSLVALLEDVRVGDAVELAWTTTPRERLPGLAFATYFAFAWRAPVAAARVALHLAEATPVNWRLVPGVEHALPEERASPNLVEWSLTDVPRFEAESNVPGRHWHWPMLEVSGWQSWAEVAGFLTELWHEALNSDAEAIAAEVETLLSDLSLAPAVLEAIRFVQEDVRYLAVDFGHGAGMLPNAAGTVLRRRFGDCKDKAVLLTAMLRALGLEARPVLVAAQWREAVMRLLPSAHAFDHAIVVFEYEGQRHFVDPTYIGQRGDLAHRVPPPYGVGLELAVTTTALLEIPGAHSNTLLLTEVFALDRRGKGRVEQILQVTGAMADDLRAQLLRDGRQAFAKTRAEALKQRLPALVPEVEGTQFDDDTEVNELVMTASHALPSWGRSDDKPPPTFTYGAYGLLLGLDTVDERDTRRQPWALRYPMRLQHRVVVRGRCVRRAKPSTFVHEGPGFRYRCEVRSKRHEVSFDYLWETTAAEVSAEQWPDYLRERQTALDQTGALVNTQGVTWGQALRITLLSLAALVWASKMVLNERGDTPPRLSQAERTAVERDANLAVDAVRRADFSAAYAKLEPLMAYYDGQFDMQCMWAEAALRSGHLDQASKAVAAARKLKPDHYLPRQLEANLLEARGDFVAARAVLDTLARQNDIEVRVLVDRARVTERSGDAPAARTAWEQVLARQPAQADALYSLAHLMWLAGDQQRADTLIENAVRSQPTPSAVLEATLQRYFAATAQHHRALEAARRAAALAPQDPLYARGLVMALLNAGDKEQAVRSAQTASETFADNPLVLSALATAAGVAQRYDIAAPAFARWVELAPADPEARSGQGYLLHLMGRDQDAREVLAKAVELFPAFGTLWLNYAVVLEALRDPAAPQARNKAIELMTPEQRVNLVR